MPKIATDYSRTQLYKIVCKDLTVTDIYVGHTTNWTKRKYQHKHNCCNETSKCNYKVYQFIRNNGDWDNWDMILIEEYSCGNKLQATQRERHWIETLNATLNQNIPSRTQQEWFEENKEHLQEYRKQYYEEYHKQHYEENRECYKQYYEENKKYRKQYYEENKKHILQKITCECGSIVSRVNLTSHKQSKKHQDYMNSKESA